MTIQELKAALADAFPHVWIEDGEQFDTPLAGALWTGEGSSVNIAGDETEYIPVDAFDMSPMFPSMYTSGVYNSLHIYLADRGFRAEAYDPGTFFIWKN